MLTPAGIYYATGVEGSNCYTAKSGTPMMCCQVQVTHKDERDAWIPLPEAMVVDIHLALSDRAWPFTADRLKTMGFAGNFESLEFHDTDGFEVRCVHEMFNDKMKEKWEVSMASDTRKAIDPGVVLNLNSRWKAENGKAPAPTGAPQTVKPEAKKEQEVPF